MLQELFEKHLGAKSESRDVDFKGSFDVGSLGEWCELIKDLVAIANSGGGVILIGIRDDGKLSNFNVKEVLKLDPADLANKIHKYTNQNFADFEIRAAKRGAAKVAAILIGSSPIPIVFTKPGSYTDENGKPKSAFAKGTVYFRHGAKSEPGTSEDLRKAINRQISSVRKEWLSGVRKASMLPDFKLVAVPKKIQESDLENAIAIRIVDDPNAPGYQKIDPDVSHPYRQKEFLSELNKRLGGKAKVSTYDFLAARRLYGLEEEAKFCHKPKFGSLQYSENLINWFINEYSKDAEFVNKSTRRYSELNSKARQEAKKR